MTVRSQRWEPDWIVLPGETIRETLAERGLTQTAAAQRMGVSQSYLSDVIRGRRAISALTAIRLEALTGVSAAMWAGLQSTYDIAAARRTLDPDRTPLPRSPVTPP